MTSTLPAALTAHGYGPWGYGHGWFPFFPIFGLLFVVLVLFLVLGALGRRRMWRGGPWVGPYAHGPWGGQPGVQPGAMPGAQTAASPESARLAAEADLARRFAAGEIDDEEYERRVSTLRRLGAG